MGWSDARPRQFRAVACGSSASDRLVTRRSPALRGSRSQAPIRGRQSAKRQVTGQFRDVGEDRINAALVLDQPELAHAGRIDEHSASREREQLTPRRRVAATLIVLTDSVDLLHFAPEQPVDKRRLPDSR